MRIESPRGLVCRPGGFPADHGRQRQPSEKRNPTQSRLHSQGNPRQTRGEKWRGERARSAPISRVNIAPSRQLNAALKSGAEKLVVDLPRLHFPSVPCPGLERERSSPFPVPYPDRARCYSGRLIQVRSVALCRFSERSDENETKVAPVSPSPRLSKDPLLWEASEGRNEQSITVTSKQQQPVSAQFTRL